MPIPQKHSTREPFAYLGTFTYLPYLPYFTSIPTDRQMDSTQASGLHDGGFAQILNFRDVAATINKHTNRPLLREGLLFRAARPDEATTADRDRLRNVYNIRTVVDLRSKSEHARAAEKRAADGMVPALLQSNEALAEPVQIPGIEYREVMVTGKDFERHLLKQLSWGGFG